LADPSVEQNGKTEEFPIQCYKGGGDGASRNVEVPRDTLRGG